jgi:hypothetical protein
MAERTVRMKMQIQTDGGPLSVLELSDFLFYFRVAYVLALRRGIDVPLEYLVPNELEQIAAEIRMENLVRRIELREVGRAQLEPWDDLQLLDIGRENPLRLVAAGVPVALAAAVILSGGKIEVAGVVKAELPPMGEGIASIRGALWGEPPPPRPAPAGPAPSPDSAGSSGKPEARTAPSGKAPSPKKLR